MRDARRAFDKGEEFLRSAESDISGSRWTAAGLGAIHSGIASADAALIAQAGVRSTSQNHGDTIELLDSLVAAFGSAQKRQLSGLLKMKNTVAYEQRPLSEVEARQLLDHARRLLRWSKGLVDERLGEQ